MQTSSLRRVLLLGVALGIVVPALISGVFLLKDRYNREIRLRVNEPMVQHAELLASSLAVPIWNLDKLVASQFVGAVMRDSSVTAIQVFDEAGNLFVEARSKANSGKAEWHEQRGVMLEKRLVGQVRISMSSAQIEKEIVQDFLKLGVALLSQVVVSFALLWLLLERLVIRPVRLLQSATSRLAKGQLDQTLEWRRQDEVGSLAQGLDTMRQNLGRLIHESETQNNALQQELQERLKAEQALRLTEEKFIGIFQASPVAMMVLRKVNKYRIVDVNDAWLRQFDWSHLEIVCQPDMAADLWCKSEDFDTVMATLERSGEIHDYEAWLKTGNKDKQILGQISGRMIHLGQDSLIILVQEDITAKRQYEQDILNLNVTLERRVSERTHALEASNNELTVVLDNLKRAQVELLRTEKMAALGSLVAGIAHELNTPIGTSVTIASTLQQHTEQLERDLATGLRRSTLQDFVNNALTGTDILMRNLSKAAELVSSFKQVAVDRASANRRQFDLEDVVTELILTLSPTIRKTPHQVVVQIPEGIMMDSYPGALGQILTNLINNAFIHGFAKLEQGQVTIAASQLDVENVQLIVSDNGCGITPANLNRIFDPFFTTRLGQGGSGLGLNIVYNLVTSVLGGSIHVDSELEQGTRFTMILPCKAQLPELEQV